MLARPFLSVVSASILALTLLAGCTGGAEEGVLRLGYFPNLTHAQPLYGVSSGLYQEHLGPTRLETQTFNAGPDAFGALLARHIDVLYVGPSPTITAIEKQGLDVVVIVAGAASGGAFFVTKPGIDDVADLAGKTFATPQRGNTQDIALKHYLRENGLSADDGGDVEVVNTANAEILSLFQQGRIQGAWVPEPWATRLVLEAGGTVYLDESELWPDGRYVTTHIVTTRAFLRERPDDIRALLAAHAEATQAIVAGGPDVLQRINDGIEDATGKRVADATLEAALPHIDFTVDPLQDTFLRQYEMSHDLGFAGPPPELARVYDLTYLPVAG